MPSILLYALESDLQTIVGYLNEDTDITYVIPDGPRRWIGNRYRVIGHGAKPAANKWWQRLQRWIRNQTTTVPRGSLQASSPVDVAAFPAALKQLQNGVPGELNAPAA